MTTPPSTTWAEVDNEGLQWKVTKIQRRPVVSVEEVKRRREEERRRASGVPQPEDWMW